MIQRAKPPVVTLILIVANLIAAFGVLGYPELAGRFGFHSDAPTFQDAITSLFLHANVLHLLGNMVFLAAVGAGVEIASGSLRFASVYFVSGLVGIFAHYLMTRHSADTTPYIGASGSIAGCAGYYSFRYVGLKVPIWPGLRVSVLAITAVWLLLQVVGAFVRLGEAGGTAYWSHLGGFAAGILISLVYRAPDLGQARIGHALIDEMSDRGPGAVVTTAKRHLRTHPKDPKALNDLAGAYSDLDEITREADALVSLLDVADDRHFPLVLQRILDVGRVGQLPNLRRTMLAERFKDTHPDISRRLLESVLLEPEDYQRPDALLALAALERDSHRVRSDELLEELARAYPLHPAMDIARQRGWVN